MQNFIPLESIQIATPCHADWDKMKGDEQARHCQSCAKNVYNLSSMTRAQAERLILEKEGHLCVRLYHRADGTVITSDCPVGISPTKKSVRTVRLMLAGMVAALVGILGGQSGRAAQDSQLVPPVSARMGDFAATTGTPAPPTHTATMGIVAPTMGEPSRQVMGKIAVPTPTPAPKAVKMPSKAVKSHGNRTSGNKHSKPVSGHRRHR